MRPHRPRAWPLHGYVHRLRHPLGWGFPAGAEHHPDAPYNARPEPDECPECGASNGAEHGIYCSAECKDRHEAL